MLDPHWFTTQERRYGNQCVSVPRPPSLLGWAEDPTQPHPVEISYGRGAIPPNVVIIYLYKARETRFEEIDINVS